MTELTNEKIKNIIAELTISPIARKELIKKCVGKLDLPKKVLTDKHPGGELNKIKCQFGNALTELINSGILVQKDNIVQARRDDKSSKKTAVDDIKRDIAIEKIIFDLLSARQLTRKQLLEEVVRLLDSDVGENAIKGDTGRIVDKAVKNGLIINKDKIYSLLSENLNNAETTKEKNARLFGKLSDEELVDKTIGMFEKWYEFKGYKVTQALNIDGSNDGGVDGIIKAEDGLGFTETILFQVKNLHDAKKNVKLCEVQEFCGVLAAHKEGTKGIFVTNAKYHADTEKFAKSFKTKYFVLIDGEKWLKLASECGFSLDK